MILVDTSVWVDHLRAGDKTLGRRLDEGMVVTHPFVVGEIALGHLRQRQLVLGTLQELPRAPVATDAEVLHFIEENGLAGSGIGYIDAHLLAAVRLMPSSSLWTRNKRLSVVATGLGLAAGSHG